MKKVGCCEIFESFKSKFMLQYLQTPAGLRMTQKLLLSLSTFIVFPKPSSSCFFLFLLIENLSACIFFKYISPNYDEFRQLPSNELSSIVVQLHEIPVGPFIQPVKVDGSTTLWHISHSFQFGLQTF